MNTAIQKQLALFYNVSVNFTYDNQTKKIHFFNDGRTNVSLWGLVLGDGPKINEKEGRIITPSSGMEMAGDDIYTWIAARTPKGVSTLYPVRIFVKNANGNEYVMHSYFGVTWENDAMIIRTQTGTIDTEPWSRSLGIAKK